MYIYLKINLFALLRDIGEFDFLAALLGLLLDFPLGLLDFGADLCQDTAVGFCLWFVLHFPASLKNCKVLFAAAVFRCRGHGFTKRNKVGKRSQI